MVENDILSKEDKLIRKGNLVNSLGVLRAMAIAGSLTKEHYIKLVKKTYCGNLDLELKKEIDKVWLESKENLANIDMLDFFKSTDELYIMADKEAKQKFKEMKQKEFEELVCENTHCKICGNEYKKFEEEDLCEHPIFKRYGFSEEEGYIEYNSVGYDTDIHCCKKCFDTIILPLFRR